MRRRDMYWVEFTGRGVEQQGWRPALIVQNDMSNAVTSYGITVVIPLSSKVKPYIGNVRIEPNAENGLDAPSDVLIGQIVAVVKASLGQKIGTLSEADMARVEDKLAYVLGLRLQQRPGN
jgi:mRNA interferase MazF